MLMVFQWCLKVGLREVVLRLKLNFQLYFLSSLGEDIRGKSSVTVSPPYVAIGRFVVMMMLAMRASRSK